MTDEELYAITEDLYAEARAEEKYETIYEEAEKKRQHAADL